MSNGFFIFCNINKEKKTFYEFLKKTNILNLNNVISTKFPIFDFESQLNYELKKFKEKKNFVMIEEYKSIIIVENRTNILPSEIYYKIINSKITFNYVLRIVPIDLFTNIESNKFDSYIIEKNILGTYKILFEGRLYEKNIKQKIFEKIIPLIKCKVQLNNPDFLIVIEAFKKKIGLCVFKNDFKNFNVSNLK